MSTTWGYLAAYHEKYAGWDLPTAHYMVYTAYMEYTEYTGGRKLYHQSGNRSPLTCHWRILDMKSDSNRLHIIVTDDMSSIQAFHVQLWHRAQPMRGYVKLLLGFRSLSWLARKRARRVYVYIVA